MSSYIIEMGSTSGAADLGIHDTGGNGDFGILPNVRIGTTFARVKAVTNGVPSPPSNEVTFTVADYDGFLKDFTEALLLGSGPLTPEPDPRHSPTTRFACPHTGTWSGWARGSTVRVRVSTRIAQERRDVMRAMVDQIGDATNGAIRAVFDTTEEEVPE